MCGTGKRHPFHGKYKVAYENDGTITAVETKLFSNAGHSHDLSFPVLERLLFYYFILLLFMFLIYLFILL